MFCDSCGTKVPSKSLFCDLCGGHLVGRRPEEKATTPSSKKTQFIFLGFLLVGGIYYLYTTRESVNLVSTQLTQAQAQLKEFQASTSAALKNQQDTISSQKAQLQLTQRASASLQVPQGSGVTSTNTDSSLVSRYSPAVVKIVCASNESISSLQLGSGTLYKTDDPSKPYVVWTNQHVVATDDGSVSQCALAIYPNLARSDQYVLFNTTGYQYFNDSLDFAVLTPTVSTSDNAGSVGDLSKYSIDLSTIKICSGVQVGDQLIVLGYPGVGGSTLTVTEGIVSGFEYDFGVRYIKTSAKIDHGNSGGLALLSSGCLLGIPTAASQGELESIGLILDLASVKRTIGQ